MYLVTKFVVEQNNSITKNCTHKKPKSNPVPTLNGGNRDNRIEVTDTPKACHKKKL